MPKPSKSRQKEEPLPSNTLIIDNGAYLLKAGFSSDTANTDADLLTNCHVIPNALARTRDRRTYIASQLENISDWTDAIFRRPVEKGQIVSWEAQKAVWDHTFFDEKTAAKDLFVKDAGDTTLVLTEPPNTLPSLQKNADEIIMEEWGFGAYSRVIGPSLNAYNDIHPSMGDPVSGTPPPDSGPVECLLVVDSGYSHTTITPIYKGRPIQRAIRRLDFGGKHLTNMLKEIVSTRHYDLHQDTHLVNDIKERTCFVSQNFNSDLEATWKGNSSRSKKSRNPTRLPTPPETSTDSTDNDAMHMDPPTNTPELPSSSSPTSLFIDYVLPDGLHIKQGFTRPHDPSQQATSTNPKKRPHSPSPTPSTTHHPETFMTLSNERFTVPEILFTPSDLGLTPSTPTPLAGIPELIHQSLTTLPPAIQATMLSNILVVGGNANIPGFVSRLKTEVRSLSHSSWNVRVAKMDDPLKATWLGGARMACSMRKNKTAFKQLVVTKEEYAEFGAGWVARKFSGLG
ncbi:putative actin family protein [Phaeomoniella chlamydospora]|uniref:Putative actin family protein n=1 Tax=Phaeomoniella chlamydospora TaxID=158046 RepID=A0A0G2E4A6_PHACM|nr:putative actin family protein [Phaeomoniella chlamydospora]